MVHLHLQLLDIVGRERLDVHRSTYNLAPVGLWVCEGLVYVRIGAFQCQSSFGDYFLGLFDEGRVVFIAKLVDILDVLGDEGVGHSEPVISSVKIVSNFFSDLL